MTRTRYDGYLDIPEGKSGGVTVSHMTVPAGEGLLEVNLRQSLLTGQPVKRVSYPYPTRWHKLSSKGHGEWMTDNPIEQYQMLPGTREMRGRVLVGGLGLGIVAKRIAAREDVTEVVVVEKNRHVVKLVAPYLFRGRGGMLAAKKINVVTDDLFHYLEDSAGRQQFDTAYYDIWQSDGEGTFHNTVIPLYRHSEGVVRGVIYNWNEKTMRGQLGLSLSTKVLMLDDPALRGVGHDGEAD